MTNVLSQSSSPYLLQHANQPVHWQEWDEEAFAQAKQRQCLIFLSIGYSTCHWCHVMAHESFDDPKTAHVLNEFFVNIKVDREEMPDVDATFMAFVQAVTGQGGWPMSVWLTPDGEPVFGGTYFPPQPAHGRASFLNVCEELQRVWSQNPEAVRAKGEELLLKLQKQACESLRGGKYQSESSTAYFEGFIENSAQLFDVEEAGFGSAPKFPRPALLRALSTAHVIPELKKELRQKAQVMFLYTLDAMASGGIHDHLAGGFHRYSVDRYWHVPHFEKMLYDQAQLIRVYTDAYLITKKNDYSNVVESTVEYVLKELSDVEGGFYCGEDADSVSPYTGAIQEGAFFLWSAEEIFNVLDVESAQLFSARYGVKQNGNIRPESDPHQEMVGMNVLYQIESIKELALKFSLSEENCLKKLASAESKLLEVRSSRPQVHKDDKVLLSWNAMMVSSLSYASRVLNKEQWLEAAKSCCSFIKKEMWDGKKLYRSWRNGKRKIEAFPADYAQLIAALIDLFETTADRSYLKWAKEIQNIMNELFWSEEQSGYVLTSRFGDKELLSLREDYDGAEPSTQSIAAENLLKLSALDVEMSYRPYLAKLLEGSLASLTENTFSVPLMLIALHRFEKGLTKVDLARHGKYWDCINEHYHEQVVIGSSQDKVLVCKGEMCMSPPENTEEFKQQVGI